MNIYLSGEALTSSIIKKKLNHFQVIFLGCHVQWREAILEGGKNRKNTLKFFRIPQILKA